MDEYDGLPLVEFAFPGPLRDQLVFAILDGCKTSTTTLALQYEVENEPLPAVGARQIVVGSSAEPVAVIETTDIRTIPLGSVSWEHARAEGEGYLSVVEWGKGHERFWHSSELRSALDDPTFTVDEETPVVIEQLRLIYVFEAQSNEPV